MLTIGRNDLQQLLASCPDLYLVEVLPESAYQEYHLRGSINVPFDANFEHALSERCPDKMQTLIVYGLNFECETSRRALQQLHELGYQNIYHYEPGKVDWKAARLPVEQGISSPTPLDKEQGYLFLISLTQLPLFDILMV